MTPQLILAELERRGIQARRVESKSPKLFLEFTDRLGRVRFIQGVVTDKGSAVACRIADDKLLTAAVAERLGVPVPATIVLNEVSDKAKQFLEQHRRVVVKPLDSAHGNGVTVGVDSPEALARAVSQAQQFSETVIVQQQVGGRDVRLLYIGGEFVAATHRKPACITGDGQHTVQEIIELTNQSPERGEKYQKKYNRIPLAAAEIFLGNRLHNIPAAGEEVPVIGTANMGSGGTAIDATDTVPPALVHYGKRLVAELRMGMCGVDFIEDGTSSYLIEINASPSFGLHMYPHQGQPRDVAAKFVDWLLDDDAH